MNRYHPRITEAPDEPFPVTRIHYINSVPGAGKTHAAINMAVETLHNGKHANYVLVYAAPTTDLLKQVQSDLRKRVKNRRDMKNVFMIDSEASPLRVATMFNGLLNSYSDADLTIARISNGSVVLITHECLRRIPLDMPGKERVSLIFDEARQCMQSSIDMKAPIRVVSFVQSNYVLNHEALAGTAIARWSWIPGRRLDEDKVRTVWKETHPKPNRKDVDNFMAFLETMKNDSQHVWVKLDSDKNSIQDFQVNVTLSPSRLFANFGKVLIMSAFFEYSQMHHMLRRQECDLTTVRGLARAARFSDGDRVTLINVTDDVIDKNRVERILKARLKCATLTYILEDESLSKYHINGGILTKYTPRDEQILIQKRYNELYKLEPLHKKTAPSYQSFLKTIRNRERFNAEIPTSAYDRRDLLLSLKPHVYSPVQYLSVASLYLQTAWLRAMKLDLEPLLLCINTHGLRTDPLELWERENLGPILKKAFVKLDNGNLNKKKLKKYKPTIQVPVINQGRNEWMQYNTAAFMATVKLAPEQIRFLKNLLPSYDPDLDRTVDQCIQFVFRSSLREATSEANCFLIVSDKKLAMQVNDALFNSINLVKPQSLLPKWKPYSIQCSRSEESKEIVQARRNKAEYKDYMYDYNKRRVSTEYGHKYKRLSGVIFRRTERLKKDPTNRELIAEIAALKEERSNLKKD